jgi:predicted secreted protein
MPRKKLGEWSHGSWRTALADPSDAPFAAIGAGVTADATRLSNAFPRGPSLFWEGWDRSLESRGKLPVGLEAEGVTLGWRSLQSLQPRNSLNSRNSPQTLQPVVTQRSARGRWRTALAGPSDAPFAAIGVGVTADATTLSNAFPRGPSLFWEGWDRSLGARGKLLVGLEAEG